MFPLIITNVILPANLMLNVFSIFRIQLLNLFLMEIARAVVAVMGSKVDWIGSSPRMMSSGSLQITVHEPQKGLQRPIMKYHIRILSPVRYLIHMIIQVMRIQVVVECDIVFLQTTHIHSPKKKKKMLPGPKDRDPWVDMVHLQV